ncbi:hypothetical protein FHG89_11910 [Micromonospora orduensis]|uniref:Uncharacterized protein n=1 Tax=Micromonospora orduensis TaxID=1420891 RepID=A0A5C4QTA0_9ACTN|nr:hypothetical protein [Micromonospora orduensis]TNH29579.1 hypothetical protein FHG89_11910 [Micromonospora orduensis]
MVLPRADPLLANAGAACRGGRPGWSVTVFNRGLHGAVPPGVHPARLAVGLDAQREAALPA